MSDKRSRPITKERLERSAFHYLQRFASTRARLHQVLANKIRRWQNGTDPTPEQRRWIDQLVAKCERLGLVDDAAYAQMKAASMHRAGKSVRAIRMKLNQMGVDEPDREEGLQEALGPDEKSLDLAAAVRFAQKKRLGPYARQTLDGEAAQKAYRRALGAFARNGFSFDVARRILEAQDAQALEDDMDLPGRSLGLG